MKSRASIILAVFIFVLFAVAVFFRKLRRVRIQNIRSFTFTYTGSDSFNSEKYFKLSVKDGEYIASFKDASSADPEIRRVNVDKSFPARLEEMLNRNKVFAWDRFDKIDRRVLDGKRFNLEIYDKNGSVVSARGYGKRPRNFKVVKNEIEAMFSDIFSTKLSCGEE
ncbi:MAG: hypothetical protein IJ457_01840 [Clostridia bacterium]|nr:hypothetical protein [Clostridia bacterium]